MVQRVLGSILHGGPMIYFLFQPVLHDWCNKGRGMYYHVCGMVHIKRNVPRTVSLAMPEAVPASGVSET